MACRNKPHDVTCILSAAGNAVTPLMAFHEKINMIREVWGNYKGDFEATLHRKIF